MCYQFHMQGPSHFWSLVLGTIIALLPIINPLAAAPFFLAITEGDTAEQRRGQARRGCFYMVAILVTFLFGGSFIMSFFGISLPGVRIAGGIMVIGIGLNMFGTGRQPFVDEQHRDAVRAKPDISFSPLAMPQLSGPGSIAVTVGFTSLAQHWHDYLAICVGIVVVAAISYLTLCLASRVGGWMGVNGLNALTKIMGFLLLCVGVQFVVNGVIGIATDPTLIKAIRDASN